MYISCIRKVTNMANNDVYVQRLFRVRKDLLADYRSVIAQLYPDCVKGEITKQINIAIENHVRLMKLSIPLKTIIK